MSVFVVSLFCQPLLRPLEQRLYDWCLKSDHDGRLYDTTFFPTAKLLVYSEKTGQWSKELTQELISFILSTASAVALYPGAHPELSPPRLEPRVLRAEENEPEWMERDSDGVCRSVRLANPAPGGGWKPTMPLRMMAILLRVPEDKIEFFPARIDVGPRQIWTDNQYRVLVRFRRSMQVTNSGAFNTEESAGVAQMVPVPVENVFHPDFRGAYAKHYRDSIVLIGTDFKEATVVNTPIGPLKDFKVDACALETLMTDWQVRYLTEREKLVTILLATVISLALAIRLPVLGIAISWLVIQAAWIWACLHMFPLGLFLGYSPVLLPSTLSAVAVAVFKLRDASQALLRFGGAGAYEAANRGDEALFEEVREKTATIVFTNVLSYLKEMERHGSPNDFFERRQAYAQLLSDVFRKHGGVILDYQGDFQMVGFNVELRSDDPDHAVHAVEACHDFLSKVPRLTRTWWEADDDEIGSAHCGICTGQVACGHVGSRRHDGGRIAQAAIGDTSNVAARLLGAAMKQKEPILLAMTTVTAAHGKILVDQLEPIPLKGKTEVVPVARPSLAGQKKP